MLRKVIKGIIMSLSMLFLLSCGGGSNSDSSKTSQENKNEKGTKITFWHSMGGVNGEALNKMVEKFNTENKDGILVEAVYQGSYDDAINKLKSAQIGNMGADLVQIYDIGTRFMIDSGWITPIQELIDADKYDIAQIEPNIAAYYTIDNKLYSMPFNSSTPILYYNKTIFDKAGIDKIPESFDEIIEISETLKSKGGAQSILAMGIYGWFFEQYLGKQGLHYVNNGNGRLDVATAVDFDKNGGALKILTAWKNLHDKGITGNFGRENDAAIADFTAGKSVITLGSTASLKQIINDVNGNFEIGTAFFPTPVKDSTGGVSIGGASLWVLDNKDDVKKKAVWEFVKYMISPEAQAFWNAQTGYFPITVAAHNEPVFKENIEKFPQFKTAIDQLHATSPKYVGALLSIFPEARQIVETEIENMINGKQTPEEAVNKMSNNINKAIEEYNLINQ